MKKYVIALDQGTTSSRTILFDMQGQVVARSQKEFPQYYPENGWVEHIPDDIYQSQLETLEKVLQTGQVLIDEIAAIGVTNQRETTILWDKTTGRPVYNAIVWQCRRTAEYCDQLIREGYSDLIRSKTGLKPDAYFSASKIKWILDHVPTARRLAEAGDLLFGTVDTWLIWNLTGGQVHVTDHTNASRTMLYNIFENTWDQELLELFDIPASILPKVVSSSEVVGYTDPRLFDPPLPIAGIAGDQQAALFGQCCFESGEAKNTYGTGCFMLMNTGDQPIISKNDLLTTMICSTSGKPQYALEGSVFIGGAVVQWLRDELGIIQTAAETEALAESIPDNDGLYLVPAFAGLGAPYWDPYGRGVLIGITRSTDRKHIVRAALEGIAYQVTDIFRTMEKDTGIPISCLKVDGGASENNFLMSFQADLLDTTLIRPQTTETTALGVAYLAGLATGVWQDHEAIKANWLPERVFTPRMTAEVRQKLYGDWQRAIEKAKLWAQ